LVVVFFCSFGDDFEHERFKFSFSKSSSSSFPTSAKRDKSLFDYLFVFFKFADMNPNKRFSTFPGAIFLLETALSLFYLSSNEGGLRTERRYEFLCRLSLTFFLIFFPFMAALKKEPLFYYRGVFF